MTISLYNPFFSGALHFDDLLIPWSSDVSPLPLLVIVRHRFGRFAAVSAGY